MWFNEIEWTILCVLVWTGLIAFVGIFFGLIGLIGWGLYSLLT